GADHADVEDAAAVGGAGIGECFTEDHLLDVGPGEFAGFGRPGWGDPFAFGELLIERHLLVPVFLGGWAGGAGAGREVGAEEFADLGPEGFVFGGELELHG